MDLQPRKLDLLGGEQQDHRVDKLLGAGDARSCGLGTYDVSVY